MLPDRNFVQPLFIGTWLVLISGSVLYNAVETNYRRKALMARYMPLVVAALFLGFSTLMGGPVWFILPLLAVITLINMFAIKICPSCGKMNRNWNLFSPPNYCQSCGAPLNGGPPAS